MLHSISIETWLGVFQVQGDESGITRIDLPRSGNIGVTGKTGAGKSHPLLESAALQITEYCEGRRKVFALPLSIQGTAFQQQAWEVMRTIPYGQTMSYGEIARRLGSAGKARAVGGAANANPLPLVIPCHRVVGSDGRLTGFAGGLGLKARLLELEGIRL